MSRIAAPLKPIPPRERAPVSELIDFLAAHPEIEAFDILLVDPSGIWRGKTVRRHEVEGIYLAGRNLPGSILGLDVLGEDVDETGLVWQDGDADRCAWPVEGTLVPAPWTSPPRGQFQLALYEIDGTPCSADPRHVLRRQIAMLAARDLKAQVAFELEFYLLDVHPDSNGRPRPARLPLTGEYTSGTHVYSVEELDRLEPFSADLYRAAALQSLPVETMISEYAPGQFELTLHHCEAERAAGDLVALKRLIRGVARRHGMKACFMAKPFADRAGSGMHMHASFCDPQGRNIFADQEKAFAPALLHAIGGLLDTLCDSMLVLAPNHNSWGRFVSRSYAPTSAIWGVNNRSVAVRVPAGTPGGRHLEQRMAGVDANPFLVAAVTLAGMAQGLANRTDAGLPAEGDGSADLGRAPLPYSWLEALDVAQASSFLRDALGATMHKVLLAIKRSEAARFAAYVSPLDYELYLDTI